MRIKFAVAGLTAMLLAAGAVQAQDFKPRLVRFGYGLVEDSNQGRAVRMFAKEVEKASGGKMKVRAIGNASLGSDTQMQQALIGGAQEMMVGSTATLVGLSPEMAIWDTPFLFANTKEADAVLDGPVGEKVKASLEPKGMVGLVYWENGFRNLTNSKHAVSKLDDLNGLKIRVMQNNIFIDAFREWGANPVPMPKQELYTALEMKAVDGQENPYVDIETNKMFEVQKYLTTSRHAYTPWLILYSKKLWDKLSAEERAVLREAAIEARKLQREANKALDDKALDSLRQHGMVVSDLTPQEREKMMAKVKSVYDKNISAYGKEAPELVFETLKKIREKK